MRILAFSDVHRDLGRCADLTERSREVDLVIGAGDFASVHEGLGETISALAEIDCPALLVPGNNETEGALRAACADWESATVLHGEATVVGDRRFFGLGAGVPVTPWEWSFDLDDTRAAELLAGLEPGDFLISHSPPLGHVDRSSSGDALGSPAILEAIERAGPVYAVCGHIHESWGGRSTIGSTPVANLGPAGTLIDLGPV